ncbi:MAG TPA: ATP-binding protein, partial [Abditibacterium sp.]
RETAQRETAQRETAQRETAQRETAPHAPDASAMPLFSALPGEGIGLSIVKRLCEIIGATLEIQSEDGKGSKITVILPRSYATESASQQPRIP